MPTCCSSHNFHSPQSLVCKNSLGAAGNGMGFIQSIKNSLLFGIIEDFISALCDFLRAKEDSKGFSNSWKNLLLLDLIVKDWNFLSVWIFELSSYQRVSGNDSTGLRESVEHNRRDQWSCDQHCGIWDFFISSSWILSVFLDFGVSHQHIHSGNLVIGKDGISIVLGVVSIFWSDISSLNSWIKFMIFISDWDKERMDTVFLVIDNQIGKDYGMVSENTQITDPPFGPSCTVTVYDETLWRGIICGSCHETLNIRSMPELSLCIASENLSFQSWLKEHLFLFFRAKVVQSSHEHVKVER